MKRIIKILIATCMIFPAVACKKTKPDEVKVKDKPAELSFCEQSQENGEDLNLNGCLYSEMPDGESVIFYLPQDTFNDAEISDSEGTPAVDKELLEAEGMQEWVFVVPFNSFVKPEDKNIDYIMEVLCTNLFGSYVRTDYQLTENDTILVFPITEFKTKDFAKLHNLIDKEGNYDRLGIAQVIAQSIADTIYQIFPDVRVKFSIGGIENIASIPSECEYVSRYSYLPYFFGSTANFVGDYSFKDYEEIMASNGIYPDAYSSDQWLKVVNNFLFNSMINEELDNGHNPSVFESKFLKTGETVYDDSVNPTDDQQTQQEVINSN